MRVVETIVAVVVVVVQHLVETDALIAICIAAPRRGRDDGLAVLVKAGASRAALNTTITATTAAEAAFYAEFLRSATPEAPLERPADNPKHQ